MSLAISRRIKNGNLVFTYSINIRKEHHSPITLNTYISQNELLKIKITIKNLIIKNEYAFKNKYMCFCLVLM